MFSPRDPTEDYSQMHEHTLIYALLFQTQTTPEIRYECQILIKTETLK